jgi:hypothetical protein
MSFALHPSEAVVNRDTTSLDDAVDEARAPSRSELSMAGQPAGKCDNALQSAPQLNQCNSVTTIPMMPTSTAATAAKNVRRV